MIIIHTSTEFSNFSTSDGSSLKTHSHFLTFMSWYFVMQLKQKSIFSMQYHNLLKLVRDNKIWIDSSSCDILYCTEIGHVSNLETVKKEIISFLVSKAFNGLSFSC